MKKLEKLARAKQHLLTKLLEFDLSNILISKSYGLNKSKDLHPELNTFFDSIDNKFKTLIKNNQSMIDMISNKILELENKIDQVGIELTNSDKYQLGFNEWGLHRHSPITVDTKAWVESKLANYADWHYPGLTLWPRSGNWLNVLVTCDPLYVLSLDHLTVDGIFSNYPEQYQLRLRRYRSLSENNFERLPQNQFSLVFAWDMFNYLKQDLIRYYLENCFSILKPGGGFIFNFTDCDIESSARTTDNFMTSFCTARWLRSTVKQIGYEIVNITNIETLDSTDGVISLCELKRPGKLTTVKNSQSMAKIIRHKNNDDEKEYSKKEIKQIQLKAIELGIDNEEKIKNAYDIPQLEKKIKEKEKSLSNGVAKPK